MDLKKKFKYDINDFSNITAICLCQCTFFYDYNFSTFDL